MTTKSKILIPIAVVVVLAAVAGVTVYRKVTSSYDGEDVRIMIPRGATVADVRDSLVAGLGRFGETVYDLWSAQKGRPSTAHGSYLVENGVSALRLSRMLKTGHQTPLRFTFNNIRLFEDLASRAGCRFEFDSTAFVAACDSLLPEMGFGRAQYPAAFLPDTYEFYWTDKAEEVVGRLARHRNDFWNDERRAAAASLGLTPVETATLASIVEEESAKGDERGKIARLYLNRLKRGMALQSDPTVKFAAGDFAAKRVRGKMLDVDSPYNTYRYTGMPPGPIRIAERATIEKVLNAPAHNYIYMCAKPDMSGYHDFASDYATHQNNAARYRRELNRRNIR